MHPTSRRAFLATSTAGLAAAVSGPAATAAVIRRIDGGLADAYPSTDPGDVRAVVGASHVDFDTVRKLVDNRPELAKANWDWGFGDWESALGAASHMARPDIAEYLIANGARPNLFTFAMLGQVDVVRATCRANPGIQRVIGPHGSFTLMRHAGDAKQDLVVEYLTELGDADIVQTDLGLGEPDSTPYVGDYRPEHADTVFHIGYRTNWKGLTFQRDDHTSRFLRNQGGDAFSPGGAPSVRIEFAVVNNRAAALTIVDGDLRVPAKRVAT